EALDGRAADIVLVTDGIDSCGRDVCAMVRDWRARGVNVDVRVRGIGMDAQTVDAWSCLTAASSEALSDVQIPAPDPDASMHSSIELDDKYLGSLLPESLAWVWAFWLLLNSPIAVALIAGVGAWFLKSRVEEFVKDQGQERGETDEDAEVPNENSAISLSEDTFKIGSNNIQKLKDFIDQKMKNAPDGRRRRKYRNFSKYNYLAIIPIMAEDKVLNEKESDLLTKAFAAWQRYRTGRVRPVPDDVLKLVQEVVTALGA
ncbi:MAG: hypothetical protein ABW199_11035, partial [Caulobacterales bacterium]